jgi:hypothetical protein
MLAAIGHVNCVKRDAVDEAGKGWQEAHDECNDTAPVGAVSGGIAVNAVEVVHIGYGHVTAARDKVAIGHVTSAFYSSFKMSRIRSFAYSVMRIAVMGPKKIV